MEPTYTINDILELTEQIKRLTAERDAARGNAEHVRDSFLRLAGGHSESIQFVWERKIQ